MRDAHEDPTAQAELDALGLDVLPVVVRGDRHLVVGHVEQLREWLGLPAEDGPEWSALIDATERVLLAFERMLRQLPEESITLPTPNRGRDMRNMTVNVFGFLEELIVAMDTGRFSYRDFKERDARSVDLHRVSELLEYARNARERWIARARRVPPEEVGARVVTDTKGDVTQYLALDSGGRHAAGHLRQAYEFLRQLGIEPVDEMTVDRMAPIRVQSSLY